MKTRKLYWGKTIASFFLVLFTMPLGHIPEMVSILVTFLLLGAFLSSGVERKKLSMNRIVTIVSLLLLIVSCQSYQTKKAIKSQLQMYPQTRVQDIYKNFCQDNLGPGHLVPDRDAARDYLLSELETYREDLDSARYSKPAVRYVPVGDQGNYVRVDLSVVLDSLVDAETLLDAFVRSANEGKKLSDEGWKEKWTDVETVIRKKFPDIPNTENILAAIDALIADGQYIQHHSQVFSEAYHPHYRIIARDIFEKELKPRIGD